MEIQPTRTVEQIAWAAGLFEGEGCFNAYVRKSGKIQMQVVLGMTDSDVVNRFAQIIGFGSVTHGRMTREGNKPLHEWRLYEATKVRAFIALLLPYLGERRRARALEVLSLGANVQPHNIKKTHCPQGHELSGINLVLEPFTSKYGVSYFARRCKECRTIQTRDRARTKLGITPDRYRIK